MGTFQSAIVGAFIVVGTIVSHYFLQTYAFLLTLGATIYVLAQWMKHGNSSDLMIYIRLILLLAVPFLAVYGFIQPLPTVLAFYFEAQGVVLTLAVLAWLICCALLSFGVNRAIAILLPIIAAFSALMYILRQL